MTDCVVGVDGCRAGWIACRLNSQSRATTFAIYVTFEELLAQETAARVMAVDIPIGLRNDWIPRGCDNEAKSLLGPRRSSVFPAPPRSLLTHSNYKEANDKSRRLFDRGLSQQTFHLFPKIREVDSVARTNADSRIYEGHPELAFRQFAGSDLQHGKKTVEGYNERSQILRAHGIHLPEPDQWRNVLGELRGKVQRDDVADAAIAAVVALRILRGDAVSIPANPEHDDFAIPMRMLY